MKAKLLLALADKLRTVSNDAFNSSDLHKDALFYATQVPEIRKAGFRLVERANEPGGFVTEYKGATDISAAAVFFDIGDIHAQYLFGSKEIDVWGYQHKAPFETKTGGGYSRDKEGPVWVAERIRAFVRDSTVDYLDRTAHRAA